MTSFDPVLESTPPSFDETEAVEIARSTFQLTLASATNLGSERDQTFMLANDDGGPVAVMKVSNPAEDPATLDMEALSVAHIRRVDNGLPVAIPQAVPGKSDTSDPQAYRALFEGRSGDHWVRMYDVLPGAARGDARTLSDEAIQAWGETTARLGRALRGFFHPKAQRTMLWDVQHALLCRPMLADVRDLEMRSAVATVFDRFEEVVIPRLPGFRSQVIHGDLNLDNVLIDDLGMITGIVDFGDMSHSALVVDLASVLDGLGDRQPTDEVFRLARLLLDGYQRVTPLEADELTVLGELWAARCAVTIAISSWRSARGLEDQEFSERYNDVAMATLDVFLGSGWSDVAGQLGAPQIRASDPTLEDRRVKALGPALEPLTYDEPIHMVSARGIWMTDASGKKYLDAYNNVPCIGHAHPRVTGAIARQSRLLNTNMRYLHESAVELAERLLETCEDGLDTVMFVNSGTEANDLAWRLAVEFTGNVGGLCTDFAYHGVSAATVDLSPESWPHGSKPTHVETWVPPDALRGAHEGISGFEAALERLDVSGYSPAVTILDGILTSDGIYDLSPAYVRSLVKLTRDAGALWVADEVQGGHGRTGEAMWSYQRFGIVPDFVTLGKPMGNGHPVAAVITRREIAERFSEGSVFFSTFGGNPVSVVAAVAVLDVLRDERVLIRVSEAGHALREAIRDVQSRHPEIGEVRGMGLATGVEIVLDASNQPAPGLAADIKEGMRDRGVLVGTTGRLGNTLKVRPPLAFTERDVPFFAAALDDTLGSLCRQNERGHHN